MIANIYVMPHKGVWAVKKEAEEEPESVHETKEEAIEAAKKNAAGEIHIVILNADGSIDNPEAYSIEPLVDGDEENKSRKE
jgi:aromatic ring-opening dioxygenase LigB subunit